MVKVMGSKCRNHSFLYRRGNLLLRKSDIESTRGNVGAGAAAGECRGQLLHLGGCLGRLLLRLRGSGRRWARRRRRRWVGRGAGGELIKGDIGQGGGGGGDGEGEEA